MVTYLLKKSYQLKDLKQIEFQDLWGDHGIFTTMWIFGKPAKILFFDNHLKNLIFSLKKYQINALRNKGNTGVWLDISTGQSKKICAMGVRASRWVTMHGFALNVNIDLDFFKLINPCGLVNSDVTSMNKELNQDKINVNEVKGDIKQNFQNIFGCNFI